jgi:hypothetical protein
VFGDDDQLGGDLVLAEVEVDVFLSFSEKKKVAIIIYYFNYKIYYNGFILLFSSNEPTPYQI